MSLHFRTRLTYCSALIALALATGCAGTADDADIGTTQSYLVAAPSTTLSNGQDWAESVTRISNPDGSCTGLLIAPHLVLTARHCGDVTTASFSTLTDVGNAVGVTESIDETQRRDYPDTADLSIRVLENVPAVRYYWNPHLDSSNSIAGRQVGMAAYGGTGLNLTQWLGRDVVGDVYTNVRDGVTFPDDKRVRYDIATTGGDSGASVFLSSGELVAVHTNTGLGQYLAYWKDGSEYPYLEWIASVIEDEEPELVDFYDALDLPILANHEHILSRFAVYGVENANVHDRALIATYRADSLMWGDHVVVGADADVGTVVAGSQGGVLRSRAAIYGDLITSAPVAEQTDVYVAGDPQTFSNIQMPLLGAFKWRFPPGALGSTNVNSGETKELLADVDYGTTVVNSGGVLELTECGDYFFQDLYINSDATLRLPSSSVCGPTRIFVRNKFEFRGSQEMNGGDAPSGDQILIGVFGADNTVWIGEDFTGTVIAPDSNIAVSCRKTVRGNLYGKSVSIYQDARVFPAPGGITNWLNADR